VKVIIIGPAGSGKGTQAKRLSTTLGVPHISTGDILREAVAEGTELGKQAAPIMAAGQLVSDDLMIGIIRDRLAKPDAAGGYILDGYPRTLQQAEKLDGLMGGNGTGDLRVVQLLVPDEAIVQRIAARRSCGSCGAIYHLISSPPANAEICDRCGAELVTRADDTESAVRKRLESFRRDTMPVLQFYRDKKTPVYEVDGLRPVDQVFEHVMGSLQQ
jgi:adenylate kinase